MSLVHTGVLSEQREEEERQRCEVERNEGMTGWGGSDARSEQRRSFTEVGKGKGARQDGGEDTGIKR